MANNETQLKVMVTTEKKGYGSYSHFTKNFNDKEVNTIFRRCQYDTSPAPLGGKRILKHAIVKDKNHKIHIYYINYQVIGFDEKGRPSVNLISSMFDHSLGKENQKSLAMIFEKIVAELEQKKGEFEIEPEYYVSLESELTAKIMSRLHFAKKYIKYMVLLILIAILSLIFLRYDNSKEMEAYLKIKETMIMESSVMEEIRIFDGYTSRHEKIPNREELFGIVVKKEIVTAYSMRTLKNYKDEINRKDKDGKKYVNSVEEYLRIIRDNRQYSKKLEEKLIFFMKLEQEYKDVVDKKDFMQMVEFVDTKARYFEYADILVIKGLIEDLEKIDANKKKRSDYENEKELKKKIESEMEAITASQTGSSSSSIDTDKMVKDISEGYENVLKQESYRKVMQFLNKNRKYLSDDQIERLEKRIKYLRQ